jgi:hypothetical protein
VPTRDRKAMWIFQYTDATHCTLRQVGLDGRVLRASRPIDCRAGISQDTPAGLLAMNNSSEPGGAVVYELIDPASGQVTRRFPNQVFAIAGDWVLGAAGPQVTYENASNNAQRVPFVLTSLSGTARHELGWPSELPWTDEVRVSPDGRLIAVAFAAQADAGQVLDVWLLDTVTRRWHHLPDMPAGVGLNFTSMAWAADGRLVLLASTGGGGDGGESILVGVWRPGEARIAVRPVELSRREGGSDSFVVW